MKNINELRIHELRIKLKLRINELRNKPLV